MSTRRRVAQETRSIGQFKLSVVQFQPTDRPIEDRFSISTSLDERRLILGVYDGHGGAHTAEHVSKTLPQALLASPPSKHAEIFQDLDQTLLNNFREEHSFFRTIISKPPPTESARLLRSGCMALVLDLDSEARSIHYANAGDCRALAFDLADPLALQQTTDLNAKSTSEQERLQREHPGESQLVVGGRLFGKLMSTRGFGDGYYKLPRGLNGWQHRRYVDILSSFDLESGKVAMSAQYDSYFYGYRTPPYITATPDVGVFQFDEGKVLVAASDGLWDLASNEEIAIIVKAGIESGAESLASYVLDTVMESRNPGDDVTVLVFHYQ
ncbi:PPM-type phosphatase domain-containing protein [Mycena chlorophos]|uniref:PPM-type phosphatase domain-containing protein n=1 Tax=Mycena chlorophos TaxID=658473 RepID=A0A8H6TMG8_MYCCL|nr:PPM-type phosphatase domain-containing protein [Mycena chlorophos]